MGVTNERYPHWCRITRKSTDDPLVDEDGFSLGRDSDFDPLGSDDGNPVNDSNEEDEKSSSESKTTVIYEGECRSYKINTTSDKGEIITSERGLALPLNQDGWERLGIVPMEGDEVVVSHGKLFKEYGRVIDRNVANASFAGTHLTWRYGRN